MLTPIESTNRSAGHGAARRIAASADLGAISSFPGGGWVESSEEEPQAARARAAMRVASATKSLLAGVAGGIYGRYRRRSLGLLGSGLQREAGGDRGHPRVAGEDADPDRMRGLGLGGDDPDPRGAWVLLRGQPQGLAEDAGVAGAAAG